MDVNLTIPCKSTTRGGGGFMGRRIITRWGSLDGIRILKTTASE